MKPSSIVIIMILCVVIGGMAMLLYADKNQNVGSVVRTGEYYATSTTAMSDGANVVAGNKQVTLGSIIIASSSASTFTIKNATSSTDTASTTLGIFQASSAQGTYTFDTILPRGLVVELGTGFTGEYIITYR